MRMSPSSTKLFSYAAKFMKNRNMETKTTTDDWWLTQPKPVWLFRKMLFPTSNHYISRMDTSLTNWIESNKHPPTPNKESAKMTTMSGWMNKQNLGLSGNSVYQDKKIFPIPIRAERISRWTGKKSKKVIFFFAKHANWYNYLRLEEIVMGIFKQFSDILQTK